jgi:TonB family protein
MKRFLFLLLLSQSIYSEGVESETSSLYLLFDGDTFIELVEKIQAIKSKKPIKDKWMKELEYQELYQEYMYENDSEIYYKIKLGDIEVPCSGSSNDFCYDVEQEKIVLRADYSWLDSHKADFNSRQETSNYTGQTAIQKNIGTSTSISSRTTYRDVVFLENLKNAYSYSLPFAEIPVSIGEMKADEKDYSAYLVFSVSPVNDKHYISGNGRLTDTKEPTINSPTERMTYERQINATHRGLLLEKSGKVIFNSTPKQQTKIKKKPGEYVPLYKVLPIYPRRAMEKKVEGYAVVKFTITESGSVDNVELVEGFCGNPRLPKSEFKPCKMFNSASVRAAKKLAYKPRIENGKPVRVNDVHHRFTFLVASD